MMHFEVCVQLATK